MIAYLKGIVLYKETHALVLDVSGVGYRVSATTDSLTDLSPGKEIGLYTHMAVREQALDLYGFLNKDDRDFFEKLLSVSGIGPKSALAIMNLAPASLLRSAIASNDSAYLTKVSGIGKKTAEKILLELRDTFEKTGVESSAASSYDADVLQALEALGYNARAAREAIRTIPADVVGVSERIKAALTRVDVPRQT